MERYELGRQDRGRLAEVIASGLHKHPPGPLKTLVAEWRVEHRRDEVARDHYPLLDWVEEKSEHNLSIYYPVEVKSGDKKTLTEQQSRAIPRVAETVNRVHPIILKMDIGDLPESYAMEAELFSGTDMSGGDTTRYRF